MRRNIKDYGRRFGYKSGYKKRKISSLPHANSGRAFWSSP
jgi:hypothetical protein